MESEYQEYEGHRIEVRDRKGKPELLIDGERVRYGLLPNGMYALDEYAFDWSDDLEELARKYIDHRRRANEIRRERGRDRRRK